MKRMTKPLILLALPLALAVLFISGQIQAEVVRKPVWAGRFYEADPSKLNRIINQLTRKAKKSRVRIPANKQLRAIIMPHAGYIYSGWTAAHASLVLHANQFSKVILLGPDHRIGFSKAAICNVTAYETPLGKIYLHNDVDKLCLQPNLFQSLPVARDQEHSLEVILPFLQNYLGEFQLIPVIVGHAEVRRLSKALDTLVDKNTLLVVSSDLSHFLAYSEAVIRDRETIDEILRLKPMKLVKTENRACGKIPLLILTEIARRHHWHPVLLHYSNSGDTAGDRSRVVGYAAIAFFGDLPMENKDNSGAQFNEAQGQILVKLARQTIADKLGANVTDPEAGASDRILQDDSFKRHCGTFVTLKIKGQLRGCIGNLTASESVLDGVRRNAINAAFHDPRFSPLSKDELDRTEIEVSILSEPQPLEFRDEQDLIAKLRVNVDGVIIRKGHASATFLPQVWEQLPEPDDFLTHLCMKAGLASDAWKSSQLEVLTYQVQYFEEKH
ncbi:MAG: AmmeMemoRadiSam system protein B [Desulfobacterales bacterium]|nr:MAG: AmmeMemoRadiSam system protein B [Desulfobacterales bacterium]